MINRLIDFSAKNCFLIIGVTIIAAIWGWWSLRHLPLDAIPDLSDTQVII
jgi:Cu(I)/Ag(I) efflux system membrane protein CusA/SilA